MGSDRDLLDFISVFEKEFIQTNTHRNPFFLTPVNENNEPVCLFNASTLLRSLFAPL